MSEAATHERIAVAMSGGLDSSVVAHLLSRDAAEGTVIGLSMLLWDESYKRVHGRCCGSLDLGDARQVAQQIGIPHYTLRMDTSFREKVVDPFVNEYLAGRTPSPCVRCNTWVKFDLLLERARELGFEAVATGHYARIRSGENGELELHVAADESKDQSYFLFELTQEQLRASRFPLGELTKDSVRDLAREAGLVVAEKGESMEVCFVASSVQEFVEGQLEQFPERYARPVAAAAGPSQVVDKDGQQLGEAAPYYRYTVGQRRGLGISSNKRLYVLNVEANKNRITVGSAAELESSGLQGDRFHWIGEIKPSEPFRATVKIRSRHPGVGALVIPGESQTVRMQFDAPQRGVAPGQAAVLYEGTRVLGGCWIESQTPEA